MSELAELAKRLRRAENNSQIAWLAADLLAAAEIVERAEPNYPCEKCGKGRTKEEGGTVFTVCDDCWPLPAPPEVKP